MKNERDIAASTDYICRYTSAASRDNIFATQFHPEGEAEGFIIRIHVYKDYGYFPPETVQELIEAVQGEHVPEAQSILHRFVNLYR